MKEIKIFFFAVNFIFLFSGTSNSQNVNVGDSSYATLKEAFDQINAGTHSGSITVLIKNSTTETTTAMLNESGFGAASYNSVLIRPDSAPVTVSGSIAGALIKLAATDSVTIDGSINDTGRCLTFKNTTTTITHNAVIWVSDRNTLIFPNVVTGAHRNNIRNCNISGGVDQSDTVFAVYGIVFSGETLALGVGSFDGVDNDFNKITNNYVYKCQYGIVIDGNSVNLNDSNVISNNLIGSSSFDSDRISGFGISVQYQNNCVIESNEVRFIGHLISETVSGSCDKIGIIAGGVYYTTGVTEGTNCRINGNYIHDLIDEATGGTAVGILVGTTSSGIPTGNTISNNVIYNVRSLPSTGGTIAGIEHRGGYNDKIIFNSIYLYGSLYFNSEGAHGIRVAFTSDSALTIKNNSIYIDYTYTASSSILRSYCITMPSASYNWGTGGCNYNDYYFPPANTKMNIGGIGTSSLFTPYSTMPSWRFVFTPMQDGLSFSANPMYTSTTYLFPLSSSPLLGAGTPISGTTKDILGEIRSSFSPSIGAYENDSAVLPVELISFTSSVNKSDVLLHWSTSSELNNAGFAIERSDGQNVSGNGEWLLAGYQAGSGTSNILHDYSFTDRNLAPGKYNYRLKQIDFNGGFKYFNLSNEVNVGAPVRYKLSQNYPNPFNPNTIISYQLPVSSFVTLKIYDILGNEVKTLVNMKQNAGSYDVYFDGITLSSGIYFYKLLIDGRNLDVKRMLLLK